MYKPPQQAFSPHISRGYTAQQNSQPVNYLSPLHALQTGWHRTCSVTAHKKQLLRTTRRKAVAEGLKALEALPPQTLPVLLLVGADDVVEEILLRHGQAIVIGQGRRMLLHAEGQPLVYWQ